MSSDTLPSWQVLIAPLPGFTALRDRIALRTAALVTLPGVRTVDADRIRDHRGPAIIALNHLNNYETVASPALLMLLRGGHVSFVADWTVRLYPLMGWLLVRSRAILVWRKHSRWRLVDRLLRRPSTPQRTLDRAADVLADGGTVALYPEGTRNREPSQLLPGRTGVARLALRTGVPVIPVGVDYVGRTEGRRADGWPRLIIRVGEPLHVPRQTMPSDEVVRRTSARIMRALSQLSGKAVHPSQTIVDVADDRTTGGTPADPVGATRVVVETTAGGTTHG